MSTPADVDLAIKGDKTRSVTFEVSHDGYPSYLVNHTLREITKQLQTEHPSDVILDIRESEVFDVADSPWMGNNNYSYDATYEDGEMVVSWRDEVVDEELQVTLGTEKNFEGAGSEVWRVTKRVNQLYDVEIDDNELRVIYKRGVSPGSKDEDPHPDFRRTCQVHNLNLAEVKVEDDRFVQVYW